MASYLSNSLMRGNVSLHTIPAAWIICLMPRMWARSAYRSATNGQDIDVRQPRDFPKMVADNTTIDPDTRDRILRAEAAMANGFDNIGLFAAAVVAGNAARLNPKLLNGLSLGYVLSRVVYNFVYINNSTSQLARTRVVTFFSGLGMIFTLFVKAGNKINGITL